MSNTEGKIIKVRIAASATTINEVFHDETLKGKGQPDNVLGVSDAVLQNIDSKVADVQVNGTSVVTDNVADITVGNATLTIQKNGTDVDSFTANATSDKSINIEVPTKLSDISTVAQQAAIDSGITSSGVEQITTNKNNITTINEKIPAAASSSNQLADKSFVNSSVATNTANFIGTFNSVEELEAYSGTLTNNDYAFVISTDAAGNTVYNRYKYTTATTPASWQFEYALNNSSFTSDQWAAINSGATTTNIGQIATNTSTISGHIADKNNPHEVTKTQVGLGNVDNTSDANKPVSTAQQSALDLKANSADVYTKTATDTLLAAKATTSLNNLTDAGKNISNWSTNVSNCVIEIPQDINLELSAGTLTVKAGTKATWPDGTTVTLSVDRTITQSNNGTRLLFMQKNGYMYLGEGAAYISSGPTDSLAGTPYHIWFDTTNNYIYVYNADGTTPTYNDSLSLPIAVYTTSGGTISRIDQIFNGFGYIGNAIFALPGVKVAYPNGRNTDGTLKSGIISLTTVFVSNLAYSMSDGSYILLTPYSVNASPVIISDDEPEIHNYYERWHSPKLNLSFYHTAGATSWTQSLMALVGKVAKTSSAFTKFDAGHPFRAVDYNDIESLSVNALSSITGYDATKTQTLKNVQGTLTWVDDA